MIKDLLVLLKDAVNDHLTVASGWGGTQPNQGQVVFLANDKSDHLDLTLGAVTLLLVNLEEEHAMRHGDPYRSTAPDGTAQRVLPPIYLNAYILFVSYYKDYEQALQYVSLILQFFQNHRVLDHRSNPALSNRVDHLTVELLSLPFAEQNNLWSILRISYQPSLLYKVRLVAYRDEDGVPVPAAGDLRPTVGS
jgi:hypothetical protein